MISEIIVLSALFINFLFMNTVIRSNVVLEFRMRVINEVFSDTESFLFQYKLAEYKSVSFKKMMLKFWKPVNSFYPTLGKQEENINGKLTKTHTN